MNRPFKISIKTDDIEYAFPTTTSEGALVRARGFGLGRLAFNIIKKRTIKNAYSRILYADLLPDQACCYLVCHLGGHFLVVFYNEIEREHGPD